MSIATSGFQNLLPFQTTNGIKEVPSDEEWFDVHDVEGYLRSRNMAFKSCQLLLTPALLDSSAANTDFPTSISGQSLSPDQHDYIALASFIDEDFIISGMHQAFKTRIFITNSTSELSRLCICIGCAAAFRRRDVEALISHSVQQYPATNLSMIM